MARGAIAAAAAGVVLAAAASAHAATFRTLAIRATWGPPLASAQSTRQQLEEADGFLRRSSFGNLGLSIDVTPTITGFTVPATCFGPGPGLGPVAEAARDAASALGYDVTAYDRFVYVFPDSVCGLGGVASGRDVMLASEGGVNWAGFLHELGHTLGFPHATRSACAKGCRVIEYGDPYSLMGAGATDFSAWEKLTAGWIADVLHVSKSGRYRLGSPQIADGLPKAMVIATSLGDYWVEDVRADTPRLVLRIVKPIHPNRPYKQSIYLRSSAASVEAHGLFRVTRLAGSEVAFRWLGRRR
jgi:hypothetical protein